MNETRKSIYTYTTASEIPVYHGRQRSAAIDLFVCQRKLRKCPSQQNTELSLVPQTIVSGGKKKQKSF